jgi:hypothetical protein
MAGGGRNRGPSKEELALQRQQLELEKQRLGLEQNASTAAEQERSLLQQQLQLQGQAQKEQTNLLTQLSQESANANREFSSILKKQQLEEERNLRLGKVEAVRASASEAVQTERANFSLLRNMQRA